VAEVAEDGAVNDGAVARAASPAQAGRRIKVVAAIVAVFALGLGGSGLWWALTARHWESTDDAYVDGNVMQITPQVAGTVVAIRADDAHFVKAGQTLVKLDGVDARIALARAEAELARTVREVRSLFATTDELGATVEMRRADVAKAEEDVARRQRLVGSGAVSAEELQHARDVLSRAQSALSAAEQQLEAGRARVDGTNIAQHPDVEAAAARVRDAYVAYARTSIPAPVSGLVAKRSVQLGQRVSPGAPLMAVVPLDEVWVDANFKENQLRHIRVGQPARLIADANGIEYHGTVAGLEAGTGAAFALLPAQNATGNWIKVVQRLPVRIALPRAELEAHPLEIGLSMTVRVDVHQQSGSQLAPSGGPAYVTPVFERQDQGADGLIADIVARNGGPRRVRPARETHPRAVPSPPAACGRDAHTAAR
jgi:membrane fusion protein (multidrug efflux system)